MRFKVLVYSILNILFVITSCSNNKSNPNESLSTSLPQQLQQTEEKNRQQLYLDSMRRVSQIADSIAKEKETRLAEEDKQQKLIEADQQINKFTSDLMNRVSPATGKNAVYHIIEPESTYDNLTKTLSVVFECSWEAIPDFNFNSTFEIHLLKGRIIYYGTGVVQQVTISKNDVLKRAIKASNAAEDLIEWLDKNSKEDTN